MEQHLPIITKKVRSLMRVMFFMLKKGITKRKLLIDLNMMMKRGKIVRKTLFRRQNNHLSFNTPPPGEYEFSCSNTPSYPLSLFSTKKKHQNKRQRNATLNNPPLVVDDSDDIIINSAVFKALDMVIRTDVSPMDSPLPGGEDGYVDEAADKFIKKFYNGLRQEI